MHLVTIVQLLLSLVKKCEDIEDEKHKYGIDYDFFNIRRGFGSDAKNSHVIIEHLLVVDFVNGSL